MYDIYITENDFETEEDMIPNVYEVCRGVTLRTVQTDRFKSGMLSVSAALPIERDATPEISLLLSVLRRGTERYPTLADINRRLDTLYGTELAIRNFYRGDRQIIGFSAELLDGAYLPEGEDLLRGVLEVMTQLLYHPLCDADGVLCRRYVESEKQQQTDLLRAQKNDPRAYASDQARALLLEGHPCGTPILGSEELVSAMTAEDLTARYKSLTERLSLECFYVGSQAPEEVCKALCEAFEQYIQMPTPLAPLSSLCLPRHEDVRRREESLAVSQGHLVLSYRTGIDMSSSALSACMVCNEMLGQSQISKLFVNVRERLSLCYFCYSSYNAHTGTLTVRCGIDPENRERAEREILRQVEAMRQGEFDDTELQAAKRALCNAYRQIKDSPAALESFYFGRGLWGINASLDDCRAEFEGITAESVRAAAERLTLDSIYFLRGTQMGEGGMDDDRSDYDED